MSEAPVKDHLAFRLRLRRELLARPEEDFFTIKEGNGHDLVH